jgi:hypothetical protein
MRIRFTIRDLLWLTFVVALPDGTQLLNGITPWRASFVCIG